MKRRLLTSSAAVAVATIVAGATMPACTVDGTPPEGLASFRVIVTLVNGSTPPNEDTPLPANRGDESEFWAFTIEAKDPTDQPIAFDGLVRVRVEPGAVISVTSEGSIGRNVLVTGGQAAGTIEVTGVYGDARLWVEDIGYLPAPPGVTPACANGADDDEDVVTDYPSDPGCAFANDDSEEVGSFAAGVSTPVHYSLPRVVDIQGFGPTTPYEYEGIEVNATGPQEVLVTRVSQTGFYVTDIEPESQLVGYNHLFAFNFSTPGDMGVCDRVTYLAGTTVEFFGYTELSFPSYRTEHPKEEDCRVPEPVLLDDELLLTDDQRLDEVALEKLEAGLVRIEGYEIPPNFGPEIATDSIFGPGKSNCDLNADGSVDFEDVLEGDCANKCSASPNCVEWNGFAGRGNFKVKKGSGSECNRDGTICLQINTGGAATFVPTTYCAKLGAGEPCVLERVVGTLATFSGGSLNWTVEVRCLDDVFCGPGIAIPGCAPKRFDRGYDEEEQCSATEPSCDRMHVACFRDLTEDDNDQGTN